MTSACVHRTYRDLLDSELVEVLYIAVRHDLHEQLYIDAVLTGKDFLGEKRFGISRRAGQRILEELQPHPGVFARCSSEMPFFGSPAGSVGRHAACRPGSGGQ